MHIELSTPSKTFLAGEYLALEGYPALLVNTEPRFKLIANTERPFHISGIHPDSPAGRLIQDEQTLLAQTSIEFINPHQNQGGFGASSAEFLMTYVLLQQLRNQSLEPTALLNCYQSYAGSKPSGADLISQWFGKITLFHKNENQIQTFDWPFEEITFCLLHTGQKVPTHEHLKQLPSIPTDLLLPWMLNIQKSFLEKNSFQFILNIQGYAQTLQQLELVTPTTQTLLKRLQQHEAVLACKGCGALGADVILVLLPTRALPSFKDWLKLQRLSLVATADDLCGGITVF